MLRGGTYPAYCSDLSRALPRGRAGVGGICRHRSDAGEILELVGGEPDAGNYMLFEEGAGAHFQLFENSTEGTPLSPVFEIIDELLDYATEECSGWGRDNKMSREDWMNVLLGKH